MQIQTPDWVKHAVFYQIFPDRFARGKQAHPRLIQQPNWEDWDAPPTLQGYKGGDLWGIMENLDYIASLGINAIYFTPIFQSACNHRYHTHDYYQVDPILGGNIAFKELLDAAHNRNIKIVLDGVFNHCSRGFFFFHDVLENGPHSPWIDWFKIEGWPLAPYTGDIPANYRGWAGNRALPEFNHDHPDVREYIMQIAEYWLEFGIDGWRLDVPFEIKTPGFWQEFRDRVKAINPQAYIVGEVWGDSRQWLDGTQFDGVMNYLFTSAAIAFTAGERVILEHVRSRDYQPYPPLSAPEYAEKIQELLTLYPWEIQLTQLNLLASHDTARLITIADGDEASVKLATLLLMTFPGAPSIYYGDEVGLPGAIDPDCRRGFPPESNWNQELLHTHRQLIALRHLYPCLRIGEYNLLYAQGDLYVFSRSLSQESGNDGEELIVAVNTGIAPAHANIEAVNFKYRPEKILYGQVEINREQTGDMDMLSLNLPPRSGCIIGN
ncbi:glycoside hydrolase family 13 protein [Calothrix sp. NIES-3974]|uniref:glycoside hydrolase family 13 protein n=1 Tax=Calothrix sp. NIES-3974 TaxID=2005462 RepID=UPI000B6056E4|nr:glycoside hydrolase family 13 protein [Calothrix sp. NIES-3974]BAZ07281.1 alpha amylase catalytic region [Calothrix sp. NIES-3974]